MDSRIIDSSTISHYDESEDMLIIQRTQDIEPIIKRNQAEAANFTGFAGSDMYRIASIPLSVLEKWKNEEGVDILKPGTDDFLAKKLLDPDYMRLRTVPQIRI